MCRQVARLPRREVVEIGADRFDVTLAEAHWKVATRPGALGGEGLAPSTQ